MEKEKLKNLISEIRIEQQISPLIPDEPFESYIKEGIQDIDNIAGTKIQYQIDLEARSLLKNYVMYANHKRLFEFKEVYAGEYTKLQIKYFANTDIS